MFFLILGCTNCIDDMCHSSNGQCLTQCLDGYREPYCYLGLINFVVCFISIKKYMLLFINRYISYEYIHSNIMKSEHNECKLS